MEPLAHCLPLRADSVARSLACLKIRSGTGSPSGTEGDTESHPPVRVGNGATECRVGPGHHRSLNTHPARPPSPLPLARPHGSNEAHHEDHHDGQASDPECESAVGPECIGGPPSGPYLSPDLMYYGPSFCADVVEATPAGQPIQPLAAPTTTKFGGHRTNIQAWEHRR